MSKILIAAIVAAVVAPVSAQAGGMGDPSIVLRRNNAICEAQKRGEGPLYPNLCQPEYPPAPVDTRRTQRVK